MTKLNRPEGQVNRTARNPEGCMQADYTGTPAPDNGTDADGQSLAARAMLANSERLTLLEEIDERLQRDHATVYPLLQAALAKADKS